jgi:hypothetical protein
VASQGCRRCTDSALLSFMPSPGPALLKYPEETLLDISRRMLHFTLPNRDYTPTSGYKLLAVPFIPCCITGKLLLPIASIALRAGCVSAVSMSMPKTAVNEDCGSESRQYDVRRAWKRALVQTEAESHRVKIGPNHPLRLGILGPNLRHCPASLGNRHIVRHPRFLFPSGP